MELDVVLVVGGLAPAAGDLACKALVVVGGVAARREERVELTRELQRVTAFQLDGAAPAVELRADVDQRATGEIDALVDVLANEVVERRPAQQRADDAGVGDGYLERTGDVVAERRERAVPQAQRGVEVELAGEVSRERARRLELPLRLAALVLTHGRPAPRVADRSRAGSHTSPPLSRGAIDGARPPHPSSRPVGV